MSNNKVIATVFAETEPWGDYYEDSLLGDEYLVSSFTAMSDQVVGEPQAATDAFEVAVGLRLFAAVHMSERCAQSPIGQFVLDISNYNGVPVVVIPEDLTRGFYPPIGTEAVQR